MLKNKRGLSEAVMTVIMIALVLVAVGVIWVVVQNVINKNASSIDYGSKCMGIVIEPGQATWVTNGDPAKQGYSVTLTRPMTSVGEAIHGVEIIVSNGVTSTTPKIYVGDVAVSQTLIVTQGEELTGTLSVVAKPFFNDTKAGVLRYCTSSVYPKQ